VLPVGVQVSPAREQHRLVAGSHPPLQYRSRLLRLHVASPVRQNAHLLAVPGFGPKTGPISDPPTLQMLEQHWAPPLQEAPTAAQVCVGVVGLTHVPSSPQTPEQQFAAVPAEHPSPTGLQAHLRTVLPFALV